MILTLNVKGKGGLFHTTIKDTSGPTHSIGDVVHAIFKVEGDTLTLATIDVSANPPQDFENARDSYIVKKAAAPKDLKLGECKPAPRATARETNVIDSLFKFPFPAAPVSLSVK